MKPYLIIPLIEVMSGIIKEIEDALINITSNRIFPIELNIPAITGKKIILNPNFCSLPFNLRAINNKRLTKIRI